jgi:hypothetical protein
MPKSAWVESQTFEDFIFAFFDLRRYYETGDDTAIGLEMLRLYMDGIRALQAAAQDTKLTLDRREAAQRLIYELHAQVEAVLYEVERNRQEQTSQDAPPSDASIAMN